MLVTTSEEAAALKSLLLRSTTDSHLRRRIVDDPGTALRSVGIDVPSGIVVRPIENTPTLRHVLLPAAPGEGALSDDELEDASGGFVAAAVLVIAMAAIFGVAMGVAMSGNQD